MDKCNEQSQKQEEFITELASFFDLLAQYDYQDKQKEKSELKTGSLGIQLPKGSVLDSDL